MTAQLDPVQERGEIKMQSVVKEGTMEKAVNVHEQDQLGRSEWAKERSYKKKRKWCKGNRGIGWTTTADSEPPPRANRLQQSSSSFSLQASPLSRWTLGCHTGNYLLNTPGSDRAWVCAHMFCQVPYSQHSVPEEGELSSSMAWPLRIVGRWL